MFDGLRLADLPTVTRGVLRQSSNTRPVIRIIEKNGVRAVVKDFSGNRFFFRNVVGRFLIWREAKAYEKLQGLKGVPRFYCVIGGLALVVEEIEGKSLENLEQEMRLPPTFFNAMETLVMAFHGRGVAHCDLKRAPNTLLGSDGTPYIVDWAASISREELWFPPLNMIFRRFMRDDEMAIVKLALRHCPDEVPAEKKARYHYRSVGEKMIRALRDRLREILQKAA
jgi:RIO-like serine/threonine protein kinase